VCVVGVWQRDFEPAVCMCAWYDELGTTVVLYYYIELSEDGLIDDRNMLERF